MLFRLADAHARSFMPLAPEKNLEPCLVTDRGLTLFHSSSIEQANTAPAAQSDRALSPAHFGASYLDLEFRWAEQHQPLKAE